MIEGTQVGDPIEYESVRSTFTSPRRKDKLFLGSGEYLSPVSFSYVLPS